MELEKAIEILSEEAYGHSVTFNEDWYDALKLGIEALKRIKETRDWAPHLKSTSLPGETNE